jgi:hypothetical protein
LLAQESGDEGAPGAAATHRATADGEFREILGFH